MQSDRVTPFQIIVLLIVLLKNEMLVSALGQTSCLGARYRSVAAGVNAGDVVRTDLVGLAGDLPRFRFFPADRFTSADFARGTGLRPFALAYLFRSGDPKSLLHQPL